MAGNVKLAAGLAAGYVLGARAGRERYERLLEAARQVADRPEVQQLAGKLRSGLDTGLDKAASAAGDRLEQARSTRPAAGERSSAGEEALADDRTQTDQRPSAGERKRPQAGQAPRVPGSAVAGQDDEERERSERSGARARR